DHMGRGCFMVAPWVGVYTLGASPWGAKRGWTFFAAVRRRFAPVGARSFLLLAQEKRNQREGTPAGTPFGFAPGFRGLSDGPSMARQTTSRRPVGSPSGLILHPSAVPQRGFSGAVRHPLREPARVCDVAKNSRACGHVAICP